MSDTATLHDFFTVDNVKDMTRMIVSKKMINYIDNKLESGDKESIYKLEHEKKYLFKFLEDDPNSFILNLYNKLGYKYLSQNISAIDMLLLYKTFSSPDRTFKNILDAKTFNTFICLNLDNISAENMEARDLIVEFIVDIGHNTDRFSIDRESGTTILFGDEFTLESIGYNRDIIVNILNIEYLDCSSMWEGKGKFKNRALLEHLKQSGL